MPKLNAATLGLVCCAVSVFATAGANAEVWATCGAFKGVSHISQGVGISDVRVGNQSSGASGETTLVHDDAFGEQPFDVIHNDDGASKSLLAEGASIMTTQPPSGGLVLVALYDNGVVETFHFSKETLVYAQSENRIDLVTSSTFVAECDWSR